MKCPNCNSKLRKILVTVEGAKSKAITYQCPKGDYVEYEKESSKKVLRELEGVTLSIQHKVIKLSKDRLGIYFSKDIIRSIGLKSGETLNMSLPDKKHIILTLER